MNTTEGRERGKRKQRIIGTKEKQIGTWQFDTQLYQYNIKCKLSKRLN